TLTTSAGYVQSGGTFNLGSFTIHDQGDWTRTVGAGGVFNAGTGTVDFDLALGGAITVQQEINAGDPFFSVTHSATGTLQLNEDLTLVGNLLSSAGTLNANNKNINIQGNWTDHATITNLATVTFEGAPTEMIVAASAFNNLTI